MEGLTWLGMANPDIQVFEMTTGEGLKQSHEKSVAERFLNLYNLYLKKSFQFAKLEHFSNWCIEGDWDLRQGTVLTVPKKAGRQSGFSR